MRTERSSFAPLNRSTIKNRELFDIPEKRKRELYLSVERERERERERDRAQEREKNQRCVYLLILRFAFQPTESWKN